MDPRVVLLLPLLLVLGSCHHRTLSCCNAQFAALPHSLALQVSLSARAAAAETLLGAVQSLLEGVESEDKEDTLDVGLNRSTASSQEDKTHQKDEVPLCSDCHVVASELSECKRTKLSENLTSHGSNVGLCRLNWDVDLARQHKASQVQLLVSIKEFCMQLLKEGMP